ncbi:phage tail fiber protein [Nocardiopsis salina]|uniref:phage tail fiber protein n=1 Tax=Nocardiopsis salina TaxID=245836 RepID=UPI000346BAAD|nr:hypothetical protein [Nocardiopsis salina]
MAFTNALYHPMLSAAADTAVEASLHTGNPGDDGSNEIDGGDYERQSVTWNSPSSGAITADDEIVFLVPALGSDEVTHVGLWNSAGDWLGDAPASTPQPYPTAGTATVEVLTLNMGNGALTASIRSH